MGAGSVMRLEAWVACSRWGPAPSCGWTRGGPVRDGGRRRYWVGGGGGEAGVGAGRRVGDAPGGGGRTAAVGGAAGAVGEGRGGALGRARPREAAARVG